VRPPYTACRTSWTCSFARRDDADHDGLSYGEETL
jgi:hypothetical protein